MEPSRPSFARVARAALIGGAVAAVVNAALYAAARAAGWLTDAMLVETPQGTQPITLGAVVMSSLLPALVAGLLFFGLSRLGRRGVVAFSVVAGIGLLVSMLPIVTILATQPLSLRLTLAAMHVVAWAAITRSLARTA